MNITCSIQSGHCLPRFTPTTWRGSVLRCESHTRKGGAKFVSSILTGKPQSWRRLSMLRPLPTAVRPHSTHIWIPLEERVNFPFPRPRSTFWSSAIFWGPPRPCAGRDSYRAGDFSSWTNLPAHVRGPCPSLAFPIFIFMGSLFFLCRLHWLRPTTFSSSICLSRWDPSSYIPLQWLQTKTSGGARSSQNLKLWLFVCTRVRLNVYLN